MLNLQRGLMLLIPLVLSLTVHEFAHAWSAWRLGDDTAARSGRLSLNPLVHIDPIGTLLLPLIGVPFGWARPVPVNPAAFRSGVNMRRGMALTAAAGPTANVLLAVLAAVVYGLLIRFAPDLLVTPGVRPLLGILIELNVNLALFNLIPIPPLDGSRVVDGFMPDRLRPQWERVTAFAPFFLVAIFIFAGRILAGPSDFVLNVLEQLIRAIAPVA